MKSLILIFITILIAISMTLFLKKKEDECTLIILVKDELSIDAKSIVFNQDSSITIHLCDDSTKVYPISKVIRIIEK